MSPELRALHLRGALGAPRTEWLGDREYLVVPTVALIGDNVIHAVNAKEPEYVPAHILSAEGWDRQPLMLGHPTKDGVQISAKDPKVLAAASFGFTSNPKVNGKRLGMESWCDVQKLEALGQSAMLADLRAGKPVEVSTGSYVRTKATEGTVNGKRYAAEWTSIGPDHLAFLYGKGEGACSISMGCGAHRAAMRVLEGSDTLQESSTEESMPGPIARMAAFFRSLMPRGWGDDEVKQELRDALEMVEPGLRSGGEIIRVKNDEVIYCLYPPANYYDAPMGPSAKMTHWSRGYTFDTATQKFSVAPMRVQVEPTTVYAPMRAAADNEKDAVLAAYAASLNKRIDGLTDAEKAAALRAAAKTQDCPACEGTGQRGSEGKQEDCATCEGTGVIALKTAAESASLEEKHMTPEQKTAALKALATCGCKTTPETDEQIIEAFITASAAHATELATVKADLKTLSEKKPELKTLTKEEILAASPEIASIVAAHTARETAEKTAIIKTLEASKVLTAEQLATKSLDELKTLAAFAKVETPVDYSGRGVAQPRQASAVDYTPPNPYEKDIKALQSAKSH